GSNDGMFHCFDAVTGAELFAYVPNDIIERLPLLTDPAYSHQYYVDGPARMGDIYYDSAWHTIVLGTTGVGGKAVFALDVTDDTFSSSDVLWEVSDESTGFEHLGYTVGQPTIIRTNSTLHPWVVIFGNGYESTGHKAILYIVDAKTGELVTAIDTEADGTDTSTNGLSTPVPVDMDGNAITDRVYAGDLHGNLWRFDLTDSDPSKWKVYHKSGSDPAPLFFATNDDGQKQPITIRPTVSSHPEGGVLLTFGTGKMYEERDINPDYFQVQSMYGIRDDSSNASDEISYNSSRDEILQEQTILLEDCTTFSDCFRLISDNSVDWSSRDGWYLDLVSPVNGLEGERIIGNGLIRRAKGNDLRLIYSSFIPADHACDSGGDSWLMIFNAVTGARFDYTIFDPNGDGSFDSGDYIEYTDHGITVKIPASQKKISGGSGKTPAVISAGPLDIIIGSKVDGGIYKEDTTGDPEGKGRQSWRQLR
ncbi:MAG: pilus assembly protein, partial [Desulfovibrionales bacterium]